MNNDELKKDLKIIEKYDSLYGGAISIRDLKHAVQELIVPVKVELYSTFNHTNNLNADFVNLNFSVPNKDICEKIEYLISKPVKITIEEI